jgi:hypothetical protein
MDLEQIKSLEIGSFELYINLYNGVCYEKSKDAVKILSKRVLGKLLAFLIIKSPKRFNSWDLYQPVWCLRSDPLTADTTVKTSISRLRKLIEPDSECRYILKSEPTFWGERGQYYFNQEVDYCLIVPQSISLFSSMSL